MKLSRIMQIGHRWLGLALGVQIVLWMASGFIMSWYEIELVRGETNSMKFFPPELETRSYANPGGVIAQVTGATSVKLKNFLERTVYEVEAGDGIAMFDAMSGEKITPISEEAALSVARRDFAGEGKIATIELLREAPQEYARAVPVWRASFDDRLNTRIYVSPDTGEVTARRNDVWRLYDFFWMLHIMDYEERKDFNNPLVRAAAITGLLFALTGIYLVIVDLMRGRFLPRRKKPGN
jgi:uncharacterized iron-regulated membrane protein